MTEQKIEKGETGTTVLPNIDNGVFPECQSRTHICGYACCKFGKLGNWIFALPGEVEMAREQGLSFNHLTVEDMGEGHKIICNRPCVEGEFKSIDCVTGNTLVPTNKGLLTIKEIVNKELDVICASSISDSSKITHHLNKGKKLVYRVTNDFGYETETTKNHKFEVLDIRTGQLVWKKLKDLTLDDFVPIRTKPLVSNHESLLNLTDPKNILQRESSHNNIPQKPEKLTTDLSWLIGLIISDGSNNERGFSICNNDLDLLNLAKLKIQDIFNLDTDIKNYGQTSNLNQENAYYLNISSKVIGTWLLELGLSVNGAKTKVVPDVILHSNTECQKAFLCGFFDGDSSIGDGNFLLSSASKKLITTIHLMLVSLGIVTTKSSTKGSKNTGSSIIDYTLYRIEGGALSYNIFIDLNNSYAFYKYEKKIFERIPFSGIPSDVLLNFLEARKVQRATYLDDSGEKVPYVKGDLFVNGSTYLSYNRLKTLDEYKNLNNISEKLYNLLEKYAEDNVVFSRITSIKPIGTKTVYDVSVNRTECFIGNGYSLHNCAIYPLFPANIEVTKFIVADHRKCPIPNLELLNHLLKVRQICLDWEKNYPGTIKSMVEAGKDFTAYQPFPYEISVINNGTSEMVGLRKITNEELSEITPNVVLSDNYVAEYKISLEYLQKYTASNTPEDKSNS